MRHLGILDFLELLGGVSANGGSRRACIAHVPSQGRGRRRERYHWADHPILDVALNWAKMILLHAWFSKNDCCAVPRTQFPSIAPMARSATLMSDEVFAPFICMFHERWHSPPRGQCSVKVVAAGRRARGRSSSRWYATCTLWPFGTRSGVQPQNLRPLSFFFGRSTASRVVNTTFPSCGRQVGRASVIVRGTSSVATTKTTTKTIRTTMQRAPFRPLSVLPRHPSSRLRMRRSVMTRMIGPHPLYLARYCPLCPIP